MVKSGKIASMQLILNLPNFYHQSIQRFKRYGWQLLYKDRRQKRLAQLNLASRDALEIAQISCALNIGCDRSTSPSLCIRSSLSYEHFFKQSDPKDHNPPQKTEHHVTLMAIDLKQYPDYITYLKAIRKYSFFERKSKKALKLGFVFAPFHYENYLPDIQAIRESLKWRAAGLPKDPYVLTSDVLQSQPSHFKEIKIPHCDLHWEKWFGIFQSEPNYRQGQVISHQKLLAYARIRRAGNTVKYAELIGHFEYLNSGLMALLHLEIMRYFLESPTTSADYGIEYLTYNNLERGADGLFFWKRKALFRPHKIELLEHQLPTDFDPKQYLDLNPDVAHAKIDPAEHYRQIGHLEQRLYKPLITKQ